MYKPSKAELRVFDIGSRAELYTRFLRLINLAVNCNLRIKNLAYKGLSELSTLSQNLEVHIHVDSCVNLVYVNVKYVRLLSIA